MTAAYRLRGWGWLFATVAIALGFYLVSLRVAEERKRLEAVDARIAVAQRDIRALETEFDTRANLVQLERWNGDTLALAAPTAAQFVRNGRQLAAIDLNAPSVRTAALVVPAIAAPVAPIPAVVPAASPASPAPLLAKREPRLDPAARAPVKVATMVSSPPAFSPASPSRSARARPWRGSGRRRWQCSTTSCCRTRRSVIFSAGRGARRGVDADRRRPAAAAARRAAGRRQALVAVAHTRLMMLMMLFAAGVMVVIARLAVLALFAGPADAAARIAMIAGRGDLVDRNGAPLARTIDSWTIAVHPRQLIGDPRDIAARLAALMPDRGDQAWFHGQLTRQVNFAFLQQRASPALVEQVNAIGEPAIVFARDTQRLYPQTTLAAHALGFLSTDGHGQSGMERVLDQKLLQAGGNGPLALSLDTRVQAAMESEVGRAMTAYGAKGAGGIVMDVATGEVIAMVSMPTFNPNRIGMAGVDQLRNLTTQSVYELGSTFKPFTMAAAIDDGVEPGMAKRFDATAPMTISGRTIHDDKGHEQKRWLNIPETLIYSSNIATARIADEVGAARMQAMFRQLGFDGKAAIELHEKGRPLWPAAWPRITVMTTAYGHGIAVSPLHLASAYAALVNGGVWHPATLMKVAPGAAVPSRRVIAPATSARMRQLLRLVVTDGTGKKGDAPGYRVGGKTGTAEVAERGGYAKNANVSTFAAAFPMDAPRYVVVVTMDSPHRVAANSFQTTAAYTAAPVVSRVIARTGAMLGVMPDEHRDVDLSALTPLIWRGGDAGKAHAGEAE